VAVADRIDPTEALGRDCTTGRFTGTDGAGRSVAEQRVISARRAEVKKLYPKKTYAEIGAELGWSTATIAKDAEALGLTGQRPAGPRRKYPELDERECANPDCAERFTPPSWAPEQRFHDVPCARKAQTTELVCTLARELRTEWRRRAEAEIANLNAAGFLTARHLAAERKVTESTVSQWISRGLLKAERRVIANEPHQIVARSEFERFNAEEWPRIVARMGPGWPANWSVARCNAWDGRIGARVAAERGKRLGRRLRQEDCQLVARKADELRQHKPDLASNDLIDALVVYFRGRDAVKHPDGSRRAKRDSRYRAARAWVTRRLDAVEKAYT
jgi:hypothetical protein